MKFNSKLKEKDDKINNLKQKIIELEKFITNKDNNSIIKEKNEFQLLDNNEKEYFNNQFFGITKLDDLKNGLL